jgi:hypothetical protein
MSQRRDGTLRIVRAPSWAILVRTSVVVRRSWSTYATDTAPSVRSATAPLGPEQGIRAQPDRPVAAPVTGHFLPLLRLAILCRCTGLTSAARIGAHVPPGRQ